MAQPMTLMAIELTENIKLKNQSLCMQMSGSGMNMNGFGINMNVFSTEQINSSNNKFNVDKFVEELEEEQ